MAGPFAGPDGLLAAWSEWVRPWSSFSVRVDSWVEARPGVVLMLGEAIGRLSGPELEIATPIGAVCRVRGGTIVSMQHFLDVEQARRAAEADV